jgi:hypothetical protein
MAKEGSKTFWRGLLLVVTGILINSLGNYVYANKGKVKTFLLTLEKQLPDLRDLKISDLFSFVNEDETPLPPTVDLRPLCPPIVDQGQKLGSCTACVGVAARSMLSDIKTPLSRIYLFYYEKFLTGRDVTIPDKGSDMRSIGKALQKKGVCEESIVPYNENTFASQPSTSADTNAAKYKITAYYSLSTLAEIRQTINISKKSVLGAIDIYENMDEVGSNGVLKMPYGKSRGGHAILIVGYSDTGKYLICRNSWGTGWAKDGYFFMPYTYVTEGYLTDLWYLQL